MKKLEEVLLVVKYRYSITFHWKDKSQLFMSLFYEKLAGNVFMYPVVYDKSSPSMFFINTQKLFFHYRKKTSFEWNNQYKFSYVCV